MGLDLDYTDGKTPLDEDEKDGLLIPTITTRGELDEFEQLGVEKANTILKVVKDYVYLATNDLPRALARGLKKRNPIALWL